jgi:hypothetical protein
MHWVRRLDAAREAAIAAAGVERYRIWRLYMAGMPHAFDRGWLSIAQMLAIKPLPAAAPRPWTRQHQYDPEAPTAQRRTRLGRIGPAQPPRSPASAVERVSLLTVNVLQQEPSTQHGSRCPLAGMNSDAYSVNSVMPSCRGPTSTGLLEAWIEAQLNRSSLATTFFRATMKAIT